MQNGCYLYFLFFLQSLVTLQVARMWNNKTDSAPAPILSSSECNDAIEQMVLDGNALFTGRFFYEAVKKNPQESAIMSAFSVLQPLAELALYAESDTLNQLLTTLNLPDKSHIRCVFQRLVSKMKAEQNLVLHLASKIFASDQFPLSQNFTSDMKKVFDAEAESLNFSSTHAAANRINKWVEGETNSRIKNIASPVMFDSDTRLVLANAIYFLGNWLRQFPAKETKDRPFHINDEKTENIPTMFQEDYFKFGLSENLDCQVLELYYKGNNFSFMIFLPNKTDGLVTMVEKLQDSSKFYGAYDSTNYRKVQVYLPKIQIESEYNLISILTSIGITDIFNKRTSLLNGILEVNEPLYISAAKQKAFVLVDEKGTEAAAANVFAGATTTSLNRPLVHIFKADHPFAFYIMNKRNIIFSGIFAN